MSGPVEFQQSWDPLRLTTISKIRNTLGEIFMAAVESTPCSRILEFEIHVNTLSARIRGTVINVTLCRLHHGGGCFNNLETSHGHRRCNNDYVTPSRRFHSVFIDGEAMAERSLPVGNLCKIYKCDILSIL